MNSHWDSHVSIPLPKFDGSNYNHWKKQMKDFLTAKDLRMWLSARDGPTMPKARDEKGEFIKDALGNFVPKELTQLTPDQKASVEMDAKTIITLHAALNSDAYNVTYNLETAHDIWKKLEVTYEWTK